MHVEKFLHRLPRRSAGTCVFGDKRGEEEAKDPEATFSKIRH